MHPTGTHPSMIGIDESGELRSTKWENYSDHMNRLLSICLTEDASKPMAPANVSAPATGGPLSDWHAFYSTDAVRIETPSACASAWTALGQAAPYLGSDFLWNFYDTVSTASVLRQYVNAILIIHLTTRR